MTTDRTKTLVDLIELRTPLSEVADALKAFPWDTDTIHATLSIKDALRVLDRLAKGELHASEVEFWADAIEGRDDIAYANEAEELLQRFIFELANPELVGGPLTVADAVAWQRRLSDAVR